MSSSQAYLSALPGKVHGVGLPAQIGGGAGGELGPEETWEGEEFLSSTGSCAEVSGQD